MQIAAAFMKMRMGDDIKDIKTEKFFFEKRGGRGGKEGRDGKDKRGRKDGYGSKGDYPRRDEKGNKKKPRDVRMDGSGYDRREERRNNHYAALRIRTKKS